MALKHLLIRYCPFQWLNLFLWPTLSRMFVSRKKEKMYGIKYGYIRKQNLMPWFRLDFVFTRKGTPRWTDFVQSDPHIVVCVRSRVFFFWTFSNSSLYHVCRRKPSANRMDRLKRPPVLRAISCMKNLRPSVTENSGPRCQCNTRQY